MKKLILTFLFVLITIFTIAQPKLNRAGAGNTVVDQRLEAAKNLYIPRYNDTTQANLLGNIGIDSCGAVIFTYDVNGTWYRQCNPKKWVQHASTTTAWLLKGNEATVDGTDFIGTTDNNPLNFRVNNQKAGRIDGLLNTSYGILAFNSYDGNFVALQNTAFGGQALQNTNVGESNTAVGSGAVFSNTTGDYNTGIGRNALITNTVGNFNTGLGSVADVQANNFNEVTVIGYHARANASNATAIGANAYVNSSNSIVLGSINGVNGAIADTKTGIGTSQPTEKLHIANGTIRIVDGNQGLNKVLTSDANGVGSWQAAVNIYNSDDTLTGNRILHGNKKSLSLDSVSNFTIITDVNGYDSRSWYTIYPEWDDGNAGHIFYHTNENASDSSIFNFSGLVNLRPYGGEYYFERMPSSLTPTVDSILTINNATKKVGLVSQDIIGINTYARTLNTNTTQVGNVGAGTDDLMTYTIPANTLATNGDYIEFYMHFFFGVNANSKEIILYLGATDFYTTGAQNQNDGSLLLKGTITRMTSTTQIITIEQLGSTSSLYVTKSEYAGGGENLATSLVIKAAGIGTANDDIVQNLLIVKYWPSN